MDRSQAVKIIGVRAGSPAEKGGLKSGDVIVKLGTQTVAAIDDYISVLDKAKTGSSLEVTVEREGMSKQLTVTPQ